MSANVYCGNLLWQSGVTLLRTPSVYRKVCRENIIRELALDADRGVID